MRFITSFNENYFFQIKRSEILLRLSNVKRERYELK